MDLLETRLPQPPFQLHLCSRCSFKLCGLDFFLCGLGGHTEGHSGAQLMQLDLSPTPQNTSPHASQDFSGLLVGSKFQREKQRPPNTQPRTRAKLEKVTCGPVTTFFPSERLTHRDRPGLAGTRAAGLEHA